MAQQHRVGTVATTVRGGTGGALSVVYHSTEVVKVGPEGITLDSGGWRTATTKTRMNQASQQYGLGFSVYQKGGKWLVDTGGKTVPFADGMTFERGEG